MRHLDGDWQFLFFFGGLGAIFPSWAFNLGLVARSRNLTNGPPGYSQTVVTVNKLLALMSLMYYLGNYEVFKVQK